MQRFGNFVCQLSAETMMRVEKAIEVSLALHKEERGEVEMNELKVFNNEELGLEVRTLLNDDGSISVNAEDTAIGFGWTQEKNRKTYVRWETFRVYCQEIGFSQNVGKDDYIPESLFYRLGMKASNARADKFQNWLALEVIPSIRKTGGYQYKKMTPEEIMRVQLGMIDGHEERISKLENTMNVDYGQQRVLEKEVGKVVLEHLSGKESPAYKELGKKVFAECNRIPEITFQGSTSMTPYSISGDGCHAPTHGLQFRIAMRRWEWRSEMDIQNAIEVLRRIQHEIEKDHGKENIEVSALDTALQSMERDIKVEATGIYRMNGFYGNCPKCGRTIVYVNYCPKCGQAIKLPERKKGNHERSTNESQEQNHRRDGQP